MKKILITGVNGIIGAELCKRFIDKGYYVIGIDRTESRREDSGQFKYVKLDITAQDKVKQFFSGLSFDYLIHCAALVHKNSPDLSFNNFMKINFEGTKNIFDSVVKNKNISGFGRAIFFSTIEVYGGEGRRDEVISERDECRPITFYGKSKLVAEKYLLKLNKESKLPIIILRLAPVYSESFLRNVKRRVLVGGDKFFYRVGDGEQKISLCSRNNVIDAVERCIESEVSFGEVFNIADNQVYSFNDLLNYFRELGENHITIKIPKYIVRLGTKLVSLIFSGRKERLLSIYYKLTKDNIYSIEKAKKSLGYEPEWNFENTILKDRKILEDDKKSI